MIRGDGGYVIQLKRPNYFCPGLSERVPLCILKLVLLPNWYKLQKFLTSDIILNALWKQFGGKIVEFKPYNMVNRLLEKIG